MRRTDYDAATSEFPRDPVESVRRSGLTEVPNVPYVAMIANTSYSGEDRASNLKERDISSVYHPG